MLGPVMERLDCATDTIARRPGTTAGLVPRVTLLDRLAASSHSELVVVVAPPGYGKTTLLAQWSDRDPRRFGWLTIEEHDNHPSALLRDIAAVIDRLEPLGRPVVLVLDDLHLLRDREGLATIGRLTDDLPAGSQLAVAGRAEPPLPLARLRAEGRVLEIGAEDLALNHREATELLEQAGLDPDPGEVGELLHRTLSGWFSWLESSGRAEREGQLALLGAWLNALASPAAAAERWSETVERWPSDGAAAAGILPPDGSLALLQAALCRRGVDQMRADAESALRLVPTGTPPQAAAQLFLGIAFMLAGDRSSADHRLANAAQAGEELGVDVATVALAERSILAMSGGDWSQAEALTERAYAGARPEWLEEYAAGALLHAVLARLAIHRGDVPRARSALARAEGPRPRLTYALPHLAVQLRLELARCYLALTDLAAAMTALWEADNVLWQRPDLGVLRGQAEELRAQLGPMRRGAIGASSLTAAEVRLLRLLGTHHSFREIGGQLYLSQHTVKSQALSIYRKFGVSSRSEAIQYARDLGLLLQ
jgi:LuxR family maltose regulon positive regulatory protein